MSDPRSPAVLPPYLRRKIARRFPWGRRRALPVKAVCSRAALDGLVMLHAFAGIEVPFPAKRKENKAA